MKDLIKQMKDEFNKEYEETKHLYRSKSHFIDIKLFELTNDIDRIRDNLTVEEIDVLMKRHNEFFEEE